MSNPTSSPAKSGTSLTRLAVIVLVLLGIGGGVYLYMDYQQRDRILPAAQTDIRAILREFLIDYESRLKLAAEYTDADGDLLADPPTGPKKVVTPALLTFTAVADEDVDGAAVTWKPFLEHLAKTTGIPTVYLKVEPGLELGAGQPGAADSRGAGAKQRPNDEASQAKALAAGAQQKLWSPDQQFWALRSGQLHVTAFNTGRVPTAVNQYGFHPLFAPAAADGKYGCEMRMIVPAGSSIGKPEDVKGKTLALVSLSSHAGGKLPLTLLRDKFGLVAGTDYTVSITGNHRQSIRQVAEKKQAAACVASDVLDAMVANGEVPADAVRTVFTSGPHGPHVFGVANTLDPKVRANVQKAFETFDFAGNSVGKLYEGQKQVKFARIDYRKDFTDIRETDAKLPTVLATK